MKIFAVLAVISMVAGLSDDEVREQYSATKKKYNEDFPRSSADEAAHFLSFKKTANYVADHNEKDSGEWVAALNEFALKTEAEKQSYLGLNASRILEAQRRSIVTRSASPRLVKRALEVDYTNKLPAIKNQGSCGSCWTFGATAALEYQVNKKRSGTMKALSEQQYLDCVYEGTRDGCNGGWPTDCYTWTKNNKNMIASQADMPYTGSDGTCNTNVNSGIDGFTVSGSTYLASGDAAMETAVANEEIGVISVAIGVVNSFYSFSSGVYAEASCSSINHAVDVVGYGTMNGVGYWRVRNSWGSWGDSGYINMKRGLNGANVNTCAISKYGHYPLVSGEDADDGDDGSDDGDDDGSDGNETCTWTKKTDRKLKAKLNATFYAIDDAKAACEADSQCNGISCRNNKKCQLFKKSKSKSNDKWDAYICS